MSRIFSRTRELGLLVCSALLLLLMLFGLELSQGRTLTGEMLWLVGGFIGVYAIAHLAIRLTAPYADQVLLPVVATLNAIGLVIIYRLDLAERAGYGALADRQVLWSFAGVVLLVLTLVIVRDHKSLSRYSYILGLLGLFFLALPLVWPQPAEFADARIWIWIGPFSIQPGEFSKILLLIFFAQLLAQKRSLFTVAGKSFAGLVFPRLRDLAPIMVVWAIAILIMAISNDFGPALLLFATVLAMVYYATGRTSWLLIGIGLVAVGGYAVYQVSDKIQERVTNFLDPLANYDTTGYQPSQALFGLSWGGVTGVGLGHGHPELVPVAHSDYILAAIGEELGFAGLAAVLCLFLIFVNRGFRAAMQVRDSYGKLLAAGLATTIIIQIFVVTGGISALMPMTGLTTPFMSAGGSAIMANYILLGLLLRISNSANRPADIDKGASARDLVGAEAAR
ncbi:FtsW/RodA/SpoVE family cell cycle protein [Corynebacterium sanguinis]|uniref:FtsW/RodA/SpoVE family cell cycle protein n=1 Tax=Corynebacterium sanguinis TaxID=2594913 RepID=A0A6C1TXF7_9CORY|nr:FtsW/RodA/SpoVE family cell cycle protein [Corynebacterium sanguinis]MCT1598425.1 FtsW/RodA/SpoVE family cell cycle protein [Corynebacterium sanguinis]MCT1614604.1 FtsW/RodA/SpoVE family cell cycle protein [Corynebacterium sanguinis]MCT2252914.1 FtsW/RodA/SpoVE family cell cycle protein [Corynebacterium sanguinis]TVS24721.1 FtsW/RodA/SpoVE family cell cycle protein [Corynebacterium sanguinis]TVS24942.1 FtsW/RodA/SpoVE family cell cycle protein [Corynebacterium sanguinis]